MLKIDFSLHLGFDSQDGSEPPILEYLLLTPDGQPFPWLDEFQWKLYKSKNLIVSYIKNRLKIFRFF